MRVLGLALALALGACAAQAEQLPAATPVDAATMNGAWVVDLSTNPAEPYTQPMHLVLAEDRTVSGDFYQSEIEAGRWRSDRGRTCVSFRTTDGVGPYHTAACLVGDHIEGQTWAEHRNFLFNWNATRAP
jgi:hypothetical protein